MLFLTVIFRQDLFQLSWSGGQATMQEAKTRSSPPATRSHARHPSDGLSTGLFDCNICLEPASNPVITVCGHLYWCALRPEPPSPAALRPVARMLSHRCRAPPCVTVGLVFTRYARGTWTHRAQFPGRRPPAHPCIWSCMHASRECKSCGSSACISA